MRDHRLHAAVIAAVALAAAAPAQAAESPRRIGVVVSTAVNVTPAEARGLAEKLGAALTGELDVEVVAGAETERRLPSAGLPDECVASAECRSDIARRLDADELLFLVIVKVGERIQIDPTWADAATARVTSRAAVIIDKGDDAGKVFRAAAAGLLPHAKKHGPDIVVVTPGGEGGGRHMTTPAWIALGVTAAALAGGSIAGLSARSKFDELDGVCGKQNLPPCAPGDVSALRNRALVADVLFAVAAAGGVTTLVLYLRSDSGSGEAPPISVTPATAGLVVEVGGRF